MTVASYRIDQVCADLIERLEGARPTFALDEDAAVEAFRRIAAEHVDTVIAEHDAVLGTPGWGALLRREVMETFLPRYIRLALDHNQLEADGYHAWRKGDPVSRLLLTFAALVVATAAYRLLHTPLTLGLFVLAFVVPFAPELRRGWHRRRYAALLQEVIDDMGRIQDSLDKAPPQVLGQRIAEAVAVEEGPAAAEEARRKATMAAARQRERQG